MDYVDVIVEGAGGVWLPAAGSHGKRLLRPGTNSVPAEHWACVEEHPAIMNKLTCEPPVLRIAADDEERRTHSHVPDAHRGLRDLTVAKARPYIAGTIDRAQLEAWRNGDERKTIGRLIDDRLAELDGPDDEDEG